MATLARLVACSAAICFAVLGSRANGRAPPSLAAAGGCAGCWLWTGQAGGGQRGAHTAAEHDTHSMETLAGDNEQDGLDDGGSSEETRAAVANSLQPAIYHRASTDP